MKLSRKSFHYKYNEWFWGYSYVESQTSLCPYFWGTILAIIFGPLKLLVDAFGALADAMPSVDLPKINWPKIELSSRQEEAIGIGFIIFVIALVAIATAYAIYTGHGVIVAIIYGFIGAIVGIGIGLGKLSDYIYEKQREKRRNQPPKQKLPNPVVEMIKAKKDQYCPHLELVD